MAEKTVINNTDATLQITFFIREGDSPFSYAEEKVVLDLDPGTKADILYGETEDALLNGISILSLSLGDFYNKVQFISSVQSKLESLLNTHSILTITKEGTDYVLKGENA